MNITKFKEGDIITRNEPMRAHPDVVADSSYCGDRIVLKELDEEAKMIFYIHLDSCVLPLLASIFYS